MFVFSWERPRRGATAGFLGLAFFGGLAFIGSWPALRLYNGPHAPVLPSLSEGVVGGLFVAGAVCGSIVSWRRNPGSATGVTAAAGGLIACQSLVVTLLAMATQPPRGGATLALLVAFALAGLTAVVLALMGLRRAAHVADEAFGVAVGMGLMASSYLLLQFPVASPAPAALHVVTGILVATHAVAVAIVLLDGCLPQAMARFLALTLLLQAASLAMTAARPRGGPWEVLVHLALATVGAAWLAIAWRLLREAVDQDRMRSETAQQLLTCASREQRERLHELRSTVAGLVSGSQMLDEPGLSPETRQRLWESVRRELDRMDRLLTGELGPATEIALDKALGPMLELQRLKGRHVELHGSGDTVRGHVDSLAEVLNILVDNSATHGGVDHSIVEVVRRDDTVDITVSDEGRGIPEDQRATIFDWGRRGEDSPGEGIGLHLARRLMAEDGGSLKLADKQGRGSSFVISLPAVRRPMDDLAQGERRAWSH